MFKLKCHRSTAKSLANPVRDILEEKLDRDTEDGDRIFGRQDRMAVATELCYQLAVGLVTPPVVRCGTIDDCYDVKHYGTGYQFGTKHFVRWEAQFNHLAQLTTGRIRGLRMLLSDIDAGEFRPDPGAHSFGDEGQEVDTEIADARLLRRFYRGCAKACEQVALHADEYEDHLNAADAEWVRDGLEDGLSFR